MSKTNHKSTGRFGGMMLLCCVAVILYACNGGHTTVSGLLPDHFAGNINGKEVGLYVLKNGNGVEVCITNYGGRIVSLMVPDASGELQDIVLGHDSLADYVHVDGNFGALIGRYGNRINQGRFVLDGKEFRLPQNDFGHCLHGGPVGYHHRVWDVLQSAPDMLELSLTDEDGTAGFPGTLNVKVTYCLTEDNELSVSYDATTDKPTVVNLTNHTYFNLSGSPENDILNTVVWIDADQITPIDSTFMTDGSFADVEGTSMDFRQPKPIGQDIATDHEQLANGHGYDHNYVLNTKGDINRVAVRAFHPKTGIELDILTTEPGVQFYVGNFLDGTVKGKRGIVYRHRTAFCFEPQHYPNSPNCPAYPSTVLRPGEQYLSHTLYRFSVRKE